MQIGLFNKVVHFLLLKHSSLAATELIFHTQDESIQWVKDNSSYCSSSGAPYSYDGLRLDTHNQIVQWLETFTKCLCLRAPYKLAVLFQFCSDHTLNPVLPQRGKNLKSVTDCLTASTLGNTDHIGNSELET